MDKNVNCIWFILFIVFVILSLILGILSFHYKMEINELKEVMRLDEQGHNAEMDAMSAISNL